MSANRLKFDGLDELREQLRKLPQELAAEASGIVLTVAYAAAAEMRAGYEAHRVSGELAEGVTVTRFDAGKVAAGVIVKNRSKLAFIFENGTQTRQTALGANRGSMPPGHVFVPAITKARRSMYAKLKDLLARHGLVVSGDV